MSEYRAFVSKDVVKEAVERLPEDKLVEVFDFVSYLLAKEKERRGEEGDEEEGEGEVDPHKDPIMRRYIGGVSNGSLAKNIDFELYGE